MADSETEVDNTRLSTLFGADLGSRLAKLYFDSPPQSPKNGSPKNHHGIPPPPEMTRNSEVRKPEASPPAQPPQRHSPEEAVPSMAPGPDFPGNSTPVTVSARTAVLRKLSASGRSTGAAAAGAGTGIFAKLRSQAPVPTPDRSPDDSPPRQNNDNRDDVNEPQRSVSPELKRPPSASSSARREEMATRAAAAARRKQRREQEGSARSRNNSDDGSVRSLERELYTIYIDCRAGRPHMGCVVLTRTEFHTFTFKALRTRLAAEQQWGHGEVILQVTDSIGRLRAVQDHELVAGILRHGATLTIDAEPSNRPSSARAPNAPDNMRSSGSYSGSQHGQSWSRPAAPTQSTPRANAARPRPGTAGRMGGSRPPPQPSGGYATRAAGGAHRGSKVQTMTKGQQEMREAALWDGWLMAEIHCDPSKYTERQLQIILSQAGISTDMIRRMSRRELMQAVPDNSSGWEVARVLACSAPYQILRVAESCSSAEAKAAYRRLVVKIHPDKNADPRAGDAMAKATQALKLLST